MFKNTAAKFRVYAFDSTTGQPKTGDSANITAYVSKDYGAFAALGDTSATEEDATNAKGYYLFDAAQAETNADCIGISAKSSTANIVVIGAPATIYTRPQTGWLAPATAGRTLVVDAAGLADANVVDWKGAIAPAMTGDAFARLGAPAGASVSADIAAVKADTGAIKAKTDNLPSDPADASDIAGAFSTVNSTLGTIAGYIDTEVASIKVVTDALPNGGALTTIQADLDDIQSRLPAALVSGRIDASVGAMAADTLTSSALATSAVTEIQTGLSTLTAAGVRSAIGMASADLDTQLGAIKGDTAVTREYGDNTVVRGTVNSGASTTSIPTSAFSPAGASADQFKGRIVVFDNDTATAALRGEATDITASTNAATPTLTVTALSATPAAGDTFSVL